MEKNRVEQEAHKNQSGLNQINQIHTIEIIVVALQLWCVSDMVKSNEMVEMKHGVRRRFGMMKMEVTEARYDYSRL